MGTEPVRLVTATGNAQPRPRLSPPPRHAALQDVRTPAGPVHLEAAPSWPDAARERVAGLIAARGLAQTDSTAEARTVVRALNGAKAVRAALAHAGLPADAATAAEHDEGYLLAIRGEGERTHIEITAAHAEGVGMATRTLAQLWAPEGLPVGAIADWPGCPVRGVIEGFYGTPWSAEARAGMLRFLGAHKFNTFVYGPKDDLYHRSAWREPYPPDAFAAVREQITACRAEGLRFVYSLAPGLDIQYSSIRDVEQILEKYRTLFDAGVRHFGLYFDDIPFVFLNEADIPTYGEATPDDITPLGVAQAEVTARVFDALRTWDSRCALIFCPVEYWGDCASGYVRALRDGLPRDVDVFYTGPEICSARLETAHTRQVSERFGRRVTFWDNYPVNDAAMTGRLHTNPIAGRDADLFTAAHGLISNPMPQCETSKLALGTIAEYLWAPDRYDPAAAFERAAGALVAAEETPHLRAFAENMHYCCLHETESPRLQGEIDGLKAAWGGPEQRARMRALGAHFLALGKSCLVLERLSNAALRGEMAPWVHALSKWTGVGRAAVNLLGAPAERRPQERDEVERRLKLLDGVREETCGTVVAAFVGWALEQTA